MEILIGSLLTLQARYSFSNRSPRISSWRNGFFANYTSTSVTSMVESVRRDQAFIEIICNAPVGHDCMKDNPFSREQ